MKIRVIRGNKILLSQGRIINPHRDFVGDILIENEKISAVNEHIAVDKSVEVVDCRQRLVFPGMIDPHTHMGIPIKDIRSADDFVSGSKSALNGGVTTILDFSVLDRDQTLSDSILQRKELAASIYTDYGLHCNITRYSPELLDEIPELIKMGISSFKVFTTYSEAGMMLTYEQIEEVAKVLARHNGLLMVHAEDEEEIQKMMTRLKKGHYTDPMYHAIARPDAAEPRAIEKLAKISDRTGCYIYIVHLNTAEGFEIASRTDRMLIETCPQYLYLAQHVYARRYGRMYVASPPLRSQYDNQALWNAVRKGQIHTLGSDHCPFNLKDKAEDIPFQEIPNGIGGVETLFPLILAKFIMDKQDLTLLTRIQSTQPAKIFGLFPTKGILQPGSDADVVIVSPDQINSNWEERLVSSTDWNAYSGLPAVFPDLVFLRGKIVRDHTGVTETPSGKFLPSRSPEYVLREKV